jgi:hypothetical protein
MKIISLRIPDAEHAAMQAAADREFITISGLVRREVHRYLSQPATPATSNPTGLSKPKAPTPTQAKAASDEIAAKLDSLFDDEDEPVPHNPFARKGGRTGPLTEEERQIMLSAYDNEPSPEDSDEFPNSLPS